MVVEKEREILTGLPLHYHTVEKLENGTMTSKDPDYSYRIAHSVGSLIGEVRNYRSWIAEGNSRYSQEELQGKIDERLQLLQRYARVVPDLIKIFSSNGALRKSVKHFFKDEL